MILIPVLAVSAAIAIAVAFYKHKTLTAVLASAKKEAANIETAVVSAEASVKAEVLAIVARLKAL
jgi:hypothetical protein